MEKKYKEVSDPKIPDSGKTECCGACGDRPCESCGECHDCAPQSPGPIERLSGGWSVLGVLVGMLLIVWIVAKGVEVRRILAYPPAGIFPHTITLSATGRAQVSPDIAEIELSVLTEGSLPQESQRENTQKMNAIIEFVKSSKVDAKDIKTATYSLYPKYEYIKGQSNIVGYTLTQSLRVKLRNLELIGSMLEGATQRGANQVGDVRFLVDDSDVFKEAARTEAFKKVSAKAKDLANLAGVHIGSIISFTESGGEIPPPIFYGKAEAGISGAPPQIESGTQDIIVTVTATYEIN